MSRPSKKLRKAKTEKLKSFADIPKAVEELTRNIGVVVGIVVDRDKVLYMKISYNKKIILWKDVNMIPLPLGTEGEVTTHQIELPGVGLKTVVKSFTTTGINAKVSNANLIFDKLPMVYSLPREELLEGFLKSSIEVLDDYITYLGGTMVGTSGHYVLIAI